MLALTVAGAGVRGRSGVVCEERAEPGGGEDTGASVGAGCDADPRRLRKRQGLSRVAASGLGLPEREKAEDRPKHKRWHKQRTLFISLSACLIRLSLAESPCGITTLFFFFAPSLQPASLSDTGWWGGFTDFTALRGPDRGPCMEQPGHSCPFANERVLAAVSSLRAGLSTATSFFTCKFSSVPSRAGVGLTFSAPTCSLADPWLQCALCVIISICWLSSINTELGLFAVHQTNKQTRDLAGARTISRPSGH
jgi:hypothetical protein